MRKLLFSGLIFIGGHVFSAPTIIPSTATVYVRGQVQFTSTDTVTWAMRSGSTGTISAGGLYSAPGSFAAKSVAVGCPMLPNDHIYNTRIDNLPVDANSNSRITNILGGTTTNITFDVSFPLNVLSDETPTTDMVFNYTTANNGPFPVLPFPYMGMENGAISDDYFDSDRHVLGVSTSTCQFVEIYGLFPFDLHPTCPTCNSGSGIIYSGMEYDLPDSDNFAGSTDAAGLYIQPLSVRYDELKAGVINHALRFTMANGYNYSGSLWPGTAYTNQCSTFTICIPYGSRFRLKSSFDISGFSPTAQVVLTALKNYGMFMGDGGTSMAISVMTDVQIDTTTYNVFHTEIPGSAALTQFQFEQVNESSLMDSAGSGRVNISNAYVVPSNYAEVIATKTSDSSSATVRVGVQPVTVGTYNSAFPVNSGTLSVMAGTPQFQIPYVVHGATTTTVTCTMSPTVGTLTSGCLYTAPTTQINVLSTAAVTLTSIADPTQAMSFPLVIFPSDGMRIDVGQKAQNITSPPIPYDAAGNYGPDVDGHYWWGDPIGTLPPTFRHDGSSQSQWPSTTTVADVGLFYTYFSGGQDTAYSAMVPNGSYTLKLGFAVDPNNSDPTNRLLSVDSQGTTILSSTTFSATFGTTAYNPKTVSLPVSVANNKFYFSLRHITAGYGTVINYWSLIPVGISSALRGNTRLRGGVKMR